MARKRSDDETESFAWHFHYEKAPVLMGSVRLLNDGDILHLHENPAANAFFGLPPDGISGLTARQIEVPEEG